MDKSCVIRVNNICTGFIDIPDQISLNIYVQGCKKRCEGCQNSDLLSFSGGQEMTLSDIDAILDDHSLCEWVCWLGGDAVYQEDALKEFNKEFHNRGLKICLYTGLKFEELSDDLLENLDLVIDGEWNGVPVTEPGSNQTIRMKVSDDCWDLIGGWSCLKLMYKELVEGEK